MAEGKDRDVKTLDSEGDAVPTSAYIHSLRIEAGLTIDDVAQRAGVNPEWLERFEAGLDEEGINYDQLLKLTQATQPPRPEWWDDGHEHDLHIPSESVVDRAASPRYWERIEQVRRANRRTRG